MAVDPNALRLSDYALMSNSPLVRKVGWSLLDQDSVLNDLPLPTVETLVAKGSRFVGGSLPAVNWSKINEQPVVVNAVPSPFEEQAYMIRNAIDVDTRLLKDRNQFMDPRAGRLEAYLRSVRIDFSDKFINNNHTSGDADAFVGLRARLDDPVKYGCESELKIDAGGVNLSTAGMTAATANLFLMYLGRLLNYLGASNGAGVVLYMNEELQLRIEAAIRLLGAGGGFRTDMDAFDRPVAKYKEATIRVVGRKADQSTQIITNTETAAGLDGASTFTSLYAVRFGEDTFTGWQMEPLDQAVRYLGTLDDGVIDRTVIDWAVGLFPVSTRAIGRIYDIRMS